MQIAILECSDGAQTRIEGASARLSVDFVGARSEADHFRQAQTLLHTKYSCLSWSKCRLVCVFYSGTQAVVYSKPLITVRAYLPCGCASCEEELRHQLLATNIKGLTPERAKSFIYYDKHSFYEGTTAHIVYQRMKHAANYRARLIEPSEVPTPNIVVHYDKKIPHTKGDKKRTKVIVKKRETCPIYAAVGCWEAMTGSWPDAPVEVDETRISFTSYPTANNPGEDALPLVR